MSTQRQKFELFARLQALGFTYDESAALRRIEMALQRWAEEECNGTIQRDETTGKPFKCIYPHTGKSSRYPIADREAGALKRLARIVTARNERNRPENKHGGQAPFKGDVLPYHQGDCRGCMLYLVTRAQLTGHDGKKLPLDSNYTNGLAVCC